MELEKKTIEIPKALMRAEWSTNQVVLQEFDGRAQGRIQKAGIRTRVGNAGIEGTADLEALRIEAIRIGVVSAPWMKEGQTIEEQRVLLSQMSNRLLSWLTNNLQELNSVPEEKKNISETESSTVEVE